MTGPEDLAGDPDVSDPVSDTDEDDDELFPPWFDEWTAPPPRRPMPWHRNIRVLATLIGIALIALLISTVLLLTLRSPGDFPTGPRVTTATTSPASDRTSPPSPRSSTSPTTTPMRTGPSPTPESAPSEVPETEPSAPQPVAPPERPNTRRSGDDDGPRINVTRPPMSFTPTSVPRP